MSRKRVRISGDETKKAWDGYDNIVKRAAERKEHSPEYYDTYNEALVNFLPDWQKPYVNSVEFVDICVAFDKLTKEYSQENQHNFSVKKKCFDFYCKQKLDKKNESS